LGTRFCEEYLNLGGEVTESWRKLYNVELDCVYSSPHVIRVMESKRMRWAGQRNACMFWWENWKVRVYLGDLGIHGIIFLIWILKKWDQ